MVGLIVAKQGQGKTESRAIGGNSEAIEKYTDNCAGKCADPAWNRHELALIIKDAEISASRGA